MYLYDIQNIVFIWHTGYCIYMTYNIQAEEPWTVTYKNHFHATLFPFHQRLTFAAHWFALNASIPLAVVPVHIPFLTLAAFAYLSMERKTRFFLYLIVTEHYPYWCWFWHWVKKSIQKFINKQVIQYITSNTLAPVIVSVSGIANLDRQPNFLQSTGM